MKRKFTHHACSPVLDRRPQVENQKTLNAFIDARWEHGDHVMTLKVKLLHIKLRPK